MRLFLIWIALSSACCLSAKPLEVEVNARSAILMNADTGVVLFEKHAKIPMYPASTTKVATTLFVLDGKKADLSQIVSVSAESLRTRPKTGDQPSHWLTSDGTVMGLKRGEEISLESLLYGLMLISGNDAANVIAESLSGSVPHFMDELNEYLESIGCVKTHFCNPHGLHHPEHVTSAYDMAVMTRRALKFPKFREIVGTLSYQKEKTNKQAASEIKQWNQLLRPGSKHYYPKAIGVKTGFHCPGGNCLVSAAEDGGRTLIAVVLGCEKNPERYIDSKRLFEAAFTEKKVQRILFRKGQSYLRQVEGAKSALIALLPQEAFIEYFPSEEPDVKAFIHWDVASLPIKKGQKVGELRILDANGALLSLMPLVAKEEVQSTFFFSLKQIWKKLTGS